MINQDLFNTTTEGLLRRRTDKRCIISNGVRCSALDIVRKLLYRRLANGVIVQDCFHMHPNEVRTILMFLKAMTRSVMNSSRARKGKRASSALRAHVKLVFGKKG